MHLLSINFIDAGLKGIKGTGKEGHLQLCDVVGQ
jgi:hypothetical protein